jgi:hypothetical protein
MTSSELEAWLKEESSTSSGWSKDDGSGETIGHESGGKIVQILKKNPSKDPEKYDEGKRIISGIGMWMESGRLMSTR